ncbi:hypothetical protein SEA_NICHOLAS_4 [Mycobacterium phage Nicholas]|uniref:Uncharacterized protein n=1 Tax=Mycobacterium phage Lumos TaxID=1701852 RepID=A0A0K2CLQ1_9CAUD|nr:hypothetical protein AVU96_gp004 [Mycobacterium phage Snenia]YP_010012462.1 hypothetical protein J4T93_gp004 [Mycobacterium phage Lumos]ASM62742.1 hypothetical protein SEA_CLAUTASTROPHE_4 [Mycobacterium phage Clautastrophe]ASR86934.1 hypothetical protein SEA_KINGSOLOMON_4 [Mycobacterium phage Kingsolomon]ASR87276.1 hypothetical protein SEA_NICHOLAS_4 [Mycobacterium phage Nicholas]QDF16589.1 hypothetical protein PBI_MSGREEN_4 [Mycobacterium phage MsGreen]QPL14888.1 hypothetical protein SEA_
MINDCGSFRPSVGVCTCGGDQVEYACMTGRCVVCVDCGEVAAGARFDSD